MSQNLSPKMTQSFSRERVGYIEALCGSLGRLCSSAHRLLWLSPHTVHSPSADNWRPLQRRTDTAHDLQSANSSLRLGEDHAVTARFFLFSVVKCCMKSYGASSLFLCQKRLTKTCLKGWRNSMEDTTKWQKKNTLWKLSTESRYENIALLIQL